MLNFSNNYTQLCDKIMTAVVLIRMPQSLQLNNNKTKSSSSVTSKDDVTTSLDNSVSSLDQSCCPAPAPVRTDRRRRRVCFSTLDVYTFDQVLGDNPAVSCGAPLALAPEHSSHLNMDIGYYEYKRKAKRPTRKDLMESKQVREEYLKSQGYSQQDIDAAANQAASIKKKRERQLPKQWDKFQVAIEKTQKLLRLKQGGGESASKLLLRHQQCTRAA